MRENAAPYRTTYATSCKPAYPGWLPRFGQAITTRKNQAIDSQDSIGRPGLGKSLVGAVGGPDDEKAEANAENHQIFQNGSPWE